MPVQEEMCTLAACISRRSLPFTMLVEVGHLQCYSHRQWDHYFIHLELDTLKPSVR